MSVVVVPLFLVDVPAEASTTVRIVGTSARAIAGDCTEINPTMNATCSGGCSDTGSAFANASEMPSSSQEPDGTQLFSVSGRAESGVGGCFGNGEISIDYGISVNRSTPIAIDVSYTPSITGSPSPPPDPDFFRVVIKMDNSYLICKSDLPTCPLQHDLTPFSNTFNATVSPGSEHNVLINFGARTGCSSCSRSNALDFTVTIRVPPPLPECSGSVFDWSNPGGGAYANTINWDPPCIPSAGDTAVVALGGSTAMDFTAGAAADHLQVRGTSATMTGGTIQLLSASVDNPSLSVAESSEVTLSSGVLKCNHAAIGDVAGGGLSAVTLAGGGSATPKLKATGTIFVGRLAPGTLESNQGEVECETLSVGNDGTVVMDNGFLTSTHGVISSPGSGEAHVTLRNNANWFNLESVDVGASGGGGVIDLGEVAFFNVQQSLVVGSDGGSGDLNINAGAIAQVGGNLLIGDISGGVGSVVVSGEAQGRLSRLEVTGDAIVGFPPSQGFLTVRGSTLIEAPRVLIHGYLAVDDSTFTEDDGSVTVEGVGSVMEVEGYIALGDFAAGDLVVKDGGLVDCNELRVGSVIVGSDGELRLTGQFVLMDVAQGAQIGGSGGHGLVDLDGPNQLTVGGLLTIGSEAGGEMIVRSGSSVRVNTALNVGGQDDGSHGSLTVQGENATLTVTGPASIGDFLFNTAGSLFVKDKLSIRLVHHWNLGLDRELGLW